MVAVDGYVIPMGDTLVSALPAEVRLAEKTLETIKVPHKCKERLRKRPLRLIAVKGYISNPLRKRRVIESTDRQTWSDDNFGKEV